MRHHGLRWKFVCKVRPGNRSGKIWVWTLPNSQASRVESIKVLQRPVKSSALFCSLLGDWNLHKFNMATWEMNDSPHTRVTSFDSHYQSKNRSFKLRFFVVVGPVGPSNATHGSCGGICLLQKWRKELRRSGSSGIPDFP